MHKPHCQEQLTRAMFYLREKLSPSNKEISKLFVNPYNLCVVNELN